MICHQLGVGGEDRLAARSMSWSTSLVLLDDLVALELRSGAAAACRGWRCAWISLSSSCGIEARRARRRRSRRLPDEADHQVEVLDAPCAGPARMWARSSARARS